jgi:DNA invertase Pin-like site-specific DNA recombinase
MTTRYCAYYRVSTSSQAASRLGIEAQKTLVHDYIRTRSGELVGEFEEVVSGRDDSRGGIEAALAVCKRYGATLVIAKVDRLARRLSFVARLLEGAVPVAVASMPNADLMTLQILAVVAEAEAKLISDRTKAALAAAKARGMQLGNPRLREFGGAASKARAMSADEFCVKHFAFISGLRNAGKTFNEMAMTLNAMGISSCNGKRWWPTTVANLLARGNALQAVKHT